MMYGSQVWGATSTTNIRRLQVFQNKQVMHVVNAPWYVRRKVIHDDLKIDPISDEFPIRNELLQRPTYDPANPSSRKRPRTAMNVIFDNFPAVKRRRIDTTPTNLGI
ncbi:hypothetical protein AVEN_109443-1 [Araneus ventricosus]|uniref:Uncharacterized protein n=1 Tax=Araneus ventricosus TaxID=182803 RepID=A0A4Y1ZTW7_ARAVE|nr:hypothetical protein AVEN_109443-1 [Araneus ventricosus]